MIASLATGLSNLPPETGIGLKPQHYDAILDPDHPSGRPDWIEVHPQNYFGDGGPPHRWLAAIAEIYPLSFHSVGLSLGSAEGLMADQLGKLAALCERYRPAMVSDHLSFSGNAHDRFADLLPIPYTQEALDHFASQVDRVQQRLGRQMLIENPSCYLAYAYNDMAEPEFLMALTQRTGCGLLLDINNIVVSTGNLGGSARDWLDRIDPDVVGEMHLAGHATEQHENGPLYIDDHGSAVGDPVWSLYADFIATHGAKPTLIEWDTDVPDYAVLMAEANRAAALIPPPWGRGAMRSMVERHVPNHPQVDAARAPPPASLVPLPVPGRNAQTNFIRTINDGPDTLDPELFEGPVDRVLLGLKAHANTINHARLIALEESFPLTRTHLGEAEFNRVSRDFVETKAARASDNNLIGRDFPAFLSAKQGDDSTAELAQIEWAWLEAYHAAEADPLELTAIAGLAETELLDTRVAWHPATRLVPVSAAPSPQLELGAEQPAAILIIRPEAEVRLLPLDAATAAVAMACEKSATIGNLLALAAEQPGIADPAGPVLTLIGAAALVMTGEHDVASPDPTL